MSTAGPEIALLLLAGGYIPSPRGVTRAYDKGGTACEAARRAVAAGDGVQGEGIPASPLCEKIFENLSSVGAFLDHFLAIMQTYYTKNFSQKRG